MKVPPLQLPQSLIRRISVLDIAGICHFLQVSLGSVVMVRGLTQSAIAASLSSTYSSQSPRMSSVDESVSDAHTMSGIHHDLSTTTGMMVSLVSLRRLIVANVSFIFFREIERYLTCWSAPCRSYGREKEGRN
jgi:hypothetical protein